MPPPSDPCPVSGSFLSRSFATASLSSFHSNISVDTSEDVPLAPLTRTSSGSSSGSGPTPTSRRPSKTNSSPGTRRSPNTSSGIDRASETTVRRLMASGMSVHSTQAAKSLASAAKIGEISLVRALIKAGVPVDAVYHDTTALMAAASAGQLEMVQFLARHRADIDFRGPDGATALYLASKGGYTDVVVYLLHRRATADVAIASGRSALHVAVQGGYTEIVAELLRHWASTQRIDGAGRRAREYVTANCQEIAKILDAFDRKTALLNATAAGELEAVKYLVTRGDALETCGPEDETALLVAAGGGAGRVDIARVLLDAGADRAAALKNGSNALHLAVKAAGARGGAAMVNLLLQEGVDSRSVDARGNRAHDYADDPDVVRALEKHDLRMKLLFAAEAGNLSLVIHHTTHGADIDTRGRADGVTPLLAAVQKGCADVVQYLLEKGADVNAASKCGGLTPLHVAAEQGDCEMVECLLNHGADLTLTDVHGKQALDYAVDGRVTAILKKYTTSLNEEEGPGSNEEVAIEEPISEPITTESYSSSNSSISRRGGNESIAILGEAISSKSADEVAVLHDEDKIELRLGVTTESQELSTDQPPIDDLTNSIRSNWSCSGPPPSYSSYLRVQPPSPSDTDLLAAVQRNDLTSVQRILSQNTDIEMRSEENNFTPLCWAAQAGNLEVLQCLLVEGACVNAVTPSGFTPLLLAALGGHADIVQVLLMKSADPDASITRSGFTALLVAAFNGYVDVVRHLVKKRVNLEVRSADGSTALHLASEKGHAAVVQLLLAAGSNPNTTAQRDGSTALHTAAFMGKSAVVWLLLRSGADPQLKDSKGLTAVDQAHSEQLKRILLATKAEHDTGIAEAWWDQWRIRQSEAPKAGSELGVEGL
ncbi:Serine/threonine-protein phosphatase 6 regulatory ankyrin repeat subunit C [Phytophthora citrophthora]|uniref:Serine/threonine-protein phosphatase 6 regulatory ankyrin repeat subunit C n=1 Tax=Phytophthora citrophthora TaxID=4793 RepID=A0AAD9G9R7_9STRA|nr:Serine/threonine-protein phosphatase 6 regulatory ankyrin repeat subunit C [Phytophthora citrophthora]